MAETLGTLVDKLITTGMKLWHIQEQVSDAVDAQEGLEAETVAKLHTLNMQRNGLMAEIDVLLSKAAETGSAEATHR